MTKRVKWEMRIAAALAVMLASMSLVGCGGATLPLLGAAAMMQGTTSLKVNVGEHKAGISLKLPKVKTPVLVEEPATPD